MLKKKHGGIGAAFLKSLQITKTTVFVNEGILIPLCSRLLAYDTCLGNILHINLHSLPWILHLFIRFRDVFRVWQLDCKLVSLAEEAIQTGNRSGIASLTQLHPEHDQTCVPVAPEHVQNEFGFFRCMLIWVAVRAMRAVGKRLQGSVVPFEPAIDILPVLVVADRGLCDAVFLCVMN